MDGTLYHSPDYDDTRRHRLQWSLATGDKRPLFRENQEERQTGGKDKFSVRYAPPDLGPAEDIRSGGVRTKTQSRGRTEIAVHGAQAVIDNPSPLIIRNRKTTTMDFDEKINLSVNGKVGR